MWFENSFVVTAIGFLAPAIAATLITFGLRRLGWSRWLAAPIGAVLPAAAIFGVFLYLESQEPIGPFYALVGSFFAIVALAVGLAFAILSAALTPDRDNRPFP